MRCSPVPSQKASPAAQLPPNFIIQKLSPGCRWSLCTGPLPIYHIKVPADTGSDLKCPPAPVETHVLGGWSPANDAILDCSRNCRSYMFIGGSRPLKVSRHTLASSCLLLLPLHSEAGKLLCHTHLQPWCSGQVCEANKYEPHSWKP